MRVATRLAALVSAIILLGAAPAPASSLPPNDARRVLAVLAEPYTGPDGALEDPLPADGLSPWVSAIDELRARSAGRVRAVLRFRTWGQALVNADDRLLMARGLEPMLGLTPTAAMPIGAIAAGTGDAWLRAQLVALQAALARASAARGETLHGYLRFAHEMNGNWYPWGAPAGSPTAAQLAAAQARYKRAFRRVAALVHRYAPSVDVIWSANRSSLPAVRANDLLRWYPGDRYVDWIGVSGYNRFAGDWRTPAVLFDGFRARWATTHLDIAGDAAADHVANARPLMISETSTIDAAAPGTAGAPTDATWIAQLRAYLRARPAYRALVWFNRPKRCSDFSTNATCRVVNWNPDDGIAAKTLPWDWDSTEAGAGAFRALADDAALFLPGPA